MTAITQINVVVGANTHVSVKDQDGNAIPPSLLSWSVSPGTLASNISISPDATGFNFAASGADTTGTATVTFQGGSPTLTVPLQVINIPTSMSLTSP